MGTLGSAATRFVARKFGFICAGRVFWYGWMVGVEMSNRFFNRIFYTHFRCIYFCNFYLFGVLWDMKFIIALSEWNGGLVGSAALVGNVWYASGKAI